LGIATGTYNGTPGSVKVIQTQTGTTTTTNASSVAADAAAAAGKINDMLAEFAKLADQSSDPGGQVETAVKNVVNAFAWSGIQGVSVDGNGKDTQISIDQNKLSASLAQNTNPLDNVLQTFTGQIAALSAPPPAPPSNGAASVQPSGPIAQASMQEMLGTMFLLNSLASIGNQYASAKDVTNAYSRQCQSSRGL
jgi:hypothetical protein